MPTALSNFEAANPGLTRRAITFGPAALLLAGCNGADGVVPDVALPALPDLRSHTGWAVPGFQQGQFRNRISLLNVWASWCGYCKAEHPLLKTLEQRLGTPLYGMIYLDKPETAANYLRTAGNPFRAIASDSHGIVARSIGQRGVPATHVIGHDGRVVTSWRGGLDENGINQVLRPGLAEARKRMAAAQRA